MKRQQYTCPECGTCGVNPVNMKAPLCHRCDYKVTMKKSLNGKILKTERGNIL